MIAVAAARFAARLLGAVPAPWVPTIAFGLAAPLRVAARRQAQRLRRNASAVLGLPPRSAEGRAFLRACARHQVVSTLETIRGIFAPAGLSAEGLDEFRACVDRAGSTGKGVVLITAHTGSWELCAHFAARASATRVHVLAKPSRSRAFNAVLDDFRRRMGVNVLWIDRKTLLQDMIQAIEAGESVGFVMDQKPKDRRGPRVEFFGIQTEFVAGPAFVAAKTGCGVVSLFCLRTGPGQYRLESRVLREANHRQRDLTALTQEMASEIERAIRLHPEQWTWNYRRWRKV